MSWNATSLVDVIGRYPAGCRGEAVESAAHAGFSGAVIARVSAAAGDFCLRGWPAGQPPVQRIRGLHRLLAFVQQAGVTQIPVPVRTESGDTLVRAGGRCWQLEPWMPGAGDFRQNPSDSRLRNSMAVLAAFHRAAARFEALPEERDWFACHSASPSPAVLERRDQLRLWQRGQLDRLWRELTDSPGGEFRRLGLEIVAQCRRIGPSVARQLAAAAALPFALTPCLRDVWHDHVLFTGDEVTGLIDPAACRCENVAADLARLLGSLVADDPRGWDIALDAYRRHRPLSLDEVALIAILDRSGVLLSGLTWLERRYLRDDASVETPRVCDRLAGILARLQRMPAL